MRRSLPAVALLAWTSVALADTFTGIVFTPPALDSHTSLTAVVSGFAAGVCVPSRGTASVSGGTLTITIAPPPPLPCAAIPTSWSVPVFIGTLAPAKYDVVTMFGDAVFDRRSIAVADAEPPIVINENVGLTLGNVAATIRARGPRGASFADAIVMFDDVQAPVVGSGLDFVTVLPPPHATGAVTVRVSVPSGATFTAVNGYRYVDVDASVDRAAYETILIPLVFSGDGAVQSFWTTDFWVHNSNAYEVTQFDGPFTTRLCILGPCLQPIPQAATVKFGYPLSSSPFPHGRLMYVPRSSAAGLDFGLRARDLNRQRDSHGVEIPVVHERDFRATPFSLLDVPSDGQYRSRLRLYALGRPSRAADVRLFTMDVPYAQVARGSASFLDPENGAPAYAELDLQPLIAAATAPGPYRVEITPPESSVIPTYWGFVTVTNNQTQIVTVVTPH